MALSCFFGNACCSRVLRRSLFLINALWVGLEFSLYSKSIREGDLTFGGGERCTPVLTLMTGLNRNARAKRSPGSPISARREPRPIRRGCGGPPGASFITQRQKSGGWGRSGTRSGKVNLRWKGEPMQLCRAGTAADKPVLQVFLCCVWVMVCVWERDVGGVRAS